MTRLFDPVVIGIAGGSCAGKSTLARRMRKRLGWEQCVHLEQDRFYVDRGDQFESDGGSINFDHPDSLDFDLLEGCLGRLAAGRSASVPRYDFVTHRRLTNEERISPARWVIVEGTLILHRASLRDWLDLSIYMHCPTVERQERRVQRDFAERGRTLDGILEQFRRQVQPMHDAFVEPTKALAHHVLSGMREPDLDAVMQWVAAAEPGRRTVPDEDPSNRPAGDAFSP